MKLDDDVEALLNCELPGLLACIATNGKDGHPLVVPVWYRWDGEEIIVWTLESRLWVRNAIRNNKVGVTIYETGVGSKAVIMRGIARVETSDESFVDDEVMRITRRYVVQPDIAGYLDGWEHLRTLVKIKPSKVYVWR